MRITSTMAARRAAFASSAALVLMAATGALAGSDPSGVWINDTGRGAVEIKPCGAALCGHVVWVKDGADTKGCGRQIIGDASSAGGGRWDNGWIYSPEKRKNYDVELTPLKDGTLRVMGYAGTKLFSRTMIWTRAPADLKRCGEVEAKAAPAASSPPVSTPAVVQPAATAAVKPAEPAGVKTETAKADANAKDGNANVATAPEAPKDIAPEAQKDIAPEARKETTQEAPKNTAPSAPEKPKIADSNSDGDEGGEQPGQRRKHGGLKLGDLGLDQVLTKTKSGKCKLDLPWVKVQFNCNKD